MTGNELLKFLNRQTPEALANDISVYSVATDEVYPLDSAYLIEEGDDDSPISDILDTGNLVLYANM